MADSGSRSGPRMGLLLTLRDRFSRQLRELMPRLVQFGRRLAELARNHGPAFGRLFNSISRVARGLFGVFRRAIPFFRMLERLLGPISYVLTAISGAFGGFTEGLKIAGREISKFVKRAELLLGVARDLWNLFSQISSPQFWMDLVRSLPGADFVESLAKEVEELNAQFDEFRILFATLTKDVERGEKVMQRVVEMARGTPFQIPELTEAVGLLTSYNIEAEKAVKYMEAIGDAAAAMGRDVTETAYAFANATTGMMRGLKLYGITVGDIMKELRGAIDTATREGREKIAEAIASIFKRRFGGMMSVMMEYTTRGLKSNIQDAIIMFKRDLGRLRDEFGREIGFAGKVTGALKTVMDTINLWRDRLGWFQKWAEAGARVLSRLGDLLGYAATKFKALGEAIGRLVSSPALVKIADELQKLGQVLIDLVSNALLKRLEILRRALDYVAEGLVVLRKLVAAVIEGWRHSKLVEGLCNVESAVKGIVGTWKDWATAVGNMIEHSSKLSAVWSAFAGTVRGTLMILIGLAAQAIPVVGNLVGAFFTFGGVLDIIGSSLKGLFTYLTGRWIGRVIRSFSSFQTVLANVAGTAAGLFTLVRNGIRIFVDFVSTVSESVRVVYGFGESLDSAGGTLRSALKLVATFLSWMVRGASKAARAWLFFQKQIRAVSYYYARFMAMVTRRKEWKEYAEEVKMNMEEMEKAAEKWRQLEKAAAEWPRAVVQSFDEAREAGKRFSADIQRFIQSVPNLREALKRVFKGAGDEFTKWLEDQRESIGQLEDVLKARLDYYNSLVGAASERDPLGRETLWLLDQQKDVLIELLRLTDRRIQLLKMEVGDVRASREVYVEYLGLLTQRAELEKSITQIERNRIKSAIQLQERQLSVVGDVLDAWLQYYQQNERYEGRVRRLLRVKIQLLEAEARLQAQIAADARVETEQRLQAYVNMHRLLAAAKGLRDTLKEIKGLRWEETIVGTTRFLEEIRPTGPGGLTALVAAGSQPGRVVTFQVAIHDRRDLRGAVVNQIVPMLEQELDREVLIPPEEMTR